MISRVSFCRTITKSIGISVLLAGCASSFAGVVYRWVDVYTNPVTGPVSGEIVVDARYWSTAGSINSSYAGGNGFVPIPGIESFRFRGANLEFEVRYDIVAVPSPFPWPVYALDIIFGNFITGSRMYVNTGNDDVFLAPISGSLWRIAGFHTDSGGPCYFNGGTACSGGTGQWVLDPTTVPVPEPVSALLFGAGFLGLMLRRLQYRVAMRSPV
jgi:hypothetical protein